MSSFSLSNESSSVFEVPLSIWAAWPLAPSIVFRILWNRLRVLGDSMESGLRSSSSSSLSSSMLLESAELGRFSCRLSFKDSSNKDISASLSLSTSWRRMISCSKEWIDRSRVGDRLGIDFEVVDRNPTVWRVSWGEGNEREWILGDEWELTVPWLEMDALRECAEESSCDSDCENESDLERPTIRKH